MVKIKNVSFRYANSDGGALDNISLEIQKGECVLLCGESGCGKTTLTRMLNGLIPHYYEGETEGRVTVDVLDVTKAELYETAHYVGSVFQNPRSQFFCVDTTSEIAFGCENLGLPVDTVRGRIKDVSEELQLTELLGRNIFELSGGEKQKVACASVSSICPELFVLDEPTSNLDIDAIEDLKKTLLLWKTRGKTIVIAEHRLYWLREICDRTIYMKDGKVIFDIPMKEFASFPSEKISKLGLRTLRADNLSIPQKFFNAEETLKLNKIRFSYKEKEVLNIPEISLPIGSIIAVIGHNGAGKSTFCRCLCGLEKRFKGTISYDGTTYNRKQMLKKGYMVMQDVNHQLFCESVDDEVLLGMDSENKADVHTVLEKLDLSEYSQRHPMSLSGGQKQRVAIATAILANKEILIFDEPTSGLDYHRMEQTAQLILSLKNRKTVFIITHDPELIIRCCTHILHLENGKETECYSLTEKNTDKFQKFFRMSEWSQTPS